MRTEAIQWITGNVLVFFGNHSKPTTFIFGTTIPQFVIIKINQTKSRLKKIDNQQQLITPTNSITLELNSILGICVTPTPTFLFGAGIYDFVMIS